MSTDLENTVDTFYADAGDEGFRFILPAPPWRKGPGGLVRPSGFSHLSTIVGRGGTGKSLLALQVVTDLLRKEGGASNWPTIDERPHAAFYFTLEASPQELMRQVKEFRWGEGYGDSEDRELHKERCSGQHDRYSNGLYIVSMPAPAESLTAMNLQIRQTIARQLPRIGRLVAIVIDPLGGIDLRGDLRSELSQLKELSESHRTYLFLLAEDHVFEQHTSIEYFSQSIIHLEHDPRNQPARQLYIQKARGQNFRSGYHQLELHQSRHGAIHSRGVRIFPSIQAQSADAHELLASREENQERTNSAEHFFSMPDAKPGAKPEDLVPFDLDERIEAGSVLFLMGPPGTFKQHIASRFADPGDQTAATIYISFKADIAAVEAQGKLTKVETLDPDRGIRNGLESCTYFLDARNPLLTPEEILFCVRNAIVRSKASNVSFRRAVVWGLRRLSDLPNFAGSKTVQFLEALVTLFKAKWITSLLVDWPDIEKPSTLPIADLSQYIFLTRVCRSAESLEPKDRRDKEIVKVLEELWIEKPRRQHIGLLRAQRTGKGFHRNLGAVLLRDERGLRMEANPAEFERYWLRAGISWEKDLGLVH